MIIMWVVIAVSLLIASVASVCAMRNRKRITALELSLNSNIQTLRRELDVVNGGAVGVGSRLINVEKKLNGSIEKQQQLEDNNTDQYSYNEAATLAGRGVDASQIADQCGLSEAEASLMTLLNSQSALHTPDPFDDQQDVQRIVS
jgi:Protein of unknown function (DUF2802)